MSTTTSPLSCMLSVITPCLTCTRTVVLSVRPLSRTNFTKQRAPLPQCSTSPPSQLKIRYLKSTPSRLGRSTSSSWSAPMPKWRSASARTRSGVRPRSPAVPSSTTKSLPAPCILVNGSFTVFQVCLSKRDWVGLGGPAARFANTRASLSVNDTWSAGRQWGRGGREGRRGLFAATPGRMASAQGASDYEMARHAQWPLLAVDSGPWHCV
ncbi:hypothetical protein BGLA2_1730006 [Burkholderia gladioli]|nr:hypothetical protein BGLA2_1730006 [Burkholderia gladioli]